MRTYPTRDGGRTLHDTSHISDEVWDRMREARERADEADIKGRPSPAGSTAPPAVPITAVHVATEFTDDGGRCFVVDVETATGWRRVWTERTDHDGEISAFIEALGIAKAPEVDLS